MILYQDEHLVAANKPSGLSVHRGWDRDRDVLMMRVRDHVGMHVHPVHRLDRSASGVVLFALDPEGAKRLGAMFEEHRLEKRYLALVRGIPPDAGTIDHPIPRRLDGPRVDSVTDYLRLACFGRYCLVAARPRSGRLHQIRRHLKHISCPLIGDVRYGKGEHNRRFRDHYELRRLALHASSLTFLHPFTGDELAVHAPMPTDLAEALSALARENSVAFDVDAIGDVVQRWSPSG